MQTKHMWKAAGLRDASPGAGATQITVLTVHRIVQKMSVLTAAKVNYSQFVIVAEWTLNLFSVMHPQKYFNVQLNLWVLPPVHTVNKSTYTTIFYSLFSVGCKTQNNAECMFPFIQKGIEYNECTLNDKKNDETTWCATNIGKTYQIL